MLKEITVKPFPKALILWPYSVLLVVIPLIFVDVVFFEQKIAHIELVKLFPFILIFNLPHILQSFHPFVHKEYRKDYGKKTLFTFIFSAFLAYSLLRTSYLLYTLIFTIITGYHLSRQQIGQLFLSFSKPVEQQVKWWGYLFVFVLTATYAIATSSYRNIDLHEIFMYRPLHVLLVMLFVIFCINSYKTYRFVENTKNGKVAYFLTCLSLMVIFILTGIGYGFLAFFIARFVHDMTAFTLYIIRDIGYHQHKKTLSSKKITTIVLLPLVAMFIVFLFTTYTNFIGILVISTLALTHYFIESYLWKRGTLNMTYTKAMLK